MAVLVTLLLAGCGTPGSVGSASTQQRTRGGGGDPRPKDDHETHDAAYFRRGLTGSR